MNRADAPTIAYATPPKAVAFREDAGGVVVERPPRAGAARVVLFIVCWTATAGGAVALTGAAPGGGTPRGAAAFASASAVLAVLVSLSLADASGRSYVLEASPNGLRLTSRGLLGVRSQAWHRADMADLRLGTPTADTAGPPGLVVVTTRGRVQRLAVAIPSDQAHPLLRRLREVLQLPTSAHGGA